MITVHLFFLSSNPRPSIYSVLLGAHDRVRPEEPSTKRNAVSVIIHPQYNARQYKNDVALIKLAVDKRILYFLFKMRIRETILAFLLFL